MHRFSYNIITSKGKRNILLYHFDQNGDTIRSKEFHTPTFTHPSFFLPAGEDSFLIGGIQYTTLDAVSGPSRAYAMLVDSSFNIVWEKKYGGMSKGQFFAGAKQSDNFILAGSTVGSETSDYFDGYIANIDKNGNLNWERYINPEGINGHEPHDYLYDVITTSDGGILATGFTQIGKQSGTQDAWIIKLDSLGLCDTATCWPWLTGVGNIPSEEEVQLWAYPNPFNSELKIHIAADEVIHDGAWQLWDINGRLVRSGDLPAGETDFAVPANDLGAGVYFFHLMEGTTRLARLKVVKVQ